MRILVVSNQYAPVVGGIEVLLRQLCPALQARGHEVSVLTSTHRQAPDARSEIDGIPVHRLNLTRALVLRDPAGLARGRKAAARVLQEVAPEIIHAHDVGPNLWAVLDDDPAVPLLTTLHLGLAAIGLEQRGPMARLLRRSTWLTGVSPAVVDEALALVPSLAGRCSVIVNGLPPTPEPAPPDPQRRRIVAVGRMTDQKGFDVLLRALPAVLRLQPSAELLLVGDGPARPELEALVDELGIGAAVTMPGAARHDQIAGLLASASVVAIPSRYEGMPLVALEAAAAGRPVVATPVHGLADVVVDGETGLLVAPEHAEPLAVALAGLLGDPVRAAALGEAARRRVVERFSLERAVEAYDALFQRLLRSGTEV
jgi:glycosyltransferase involved in cell wall biosynthesis